jgi:hypothetical protein
MWASLHASPRITPDKRACGNYTPKAEAVNLTRTSSGPKEPLGLLPRVVNDKGRYRQLDARPGKAAFKRSRLRPKFRSDR